MRVRITGGGGYGVPGSGVSEGQQRVALRDLPLESQHAHEIINSLKEMGELEMRAHIVDTAGAKEPVGAKGLEMIAELYEDLGMNLSAAGVQRFKLDRGLVGGTSLSGAVAKAYARALDGDEVIIRVSKKEETELRPSERACLQFLRDLGKRNGAHWLSPVKRLLGLNNPAMSEAAEALGNEFVGVTTVEEIAKVTTMRRIPLTKEGLAALANQLIEEKKKEAADEKKKEAVEQKKAAALAARKTTED